MSADFTLPLRFKGPRTYVQGPDIHDAVCDALAARGYTSIGKVDLVCHRLVHTQLDARFLADGAENPEAHAVFRFRSGDTASSLSLVENGLPITEREPYDEEKLIAASAYDRDSKRISVTPLDGYSNAEVAVALNKHLLTSTFPEAKGKWLFARLQLSSSFRDSKFGHLEVCFQGHSNFRITRSALIGDGKPVGSLYFSLLPAE